MRREGVRDGRPLSAAPVLAATGLLAAANFFVGLGSPSLFIDEAFSWNAASAGPGELLRRVRADEVAPPTYYAGLHEWIYSLGSTSETVMRIPSALAAVALVLAVVWLTRLLATWRAALIAGGLTALSPLLLTYGQQVRAYVFAALLSTIALAAIVMAQRVGGSAQRRWLAVGAVAATASVAFHYTAGLVVGPLLVWVALRSGWSRRTRALVVAPTIAVAMLVAPLATHQLKQGHESGIATSASLTGSHLVRVLAAPFDWRAEGVNGSTLLGLVALTATCFILWRRRDRLSEDFRWLLVPAAVATPLILVGLTLLGSNVLISRYSVVAAPLALVALAVATDLATPRGRGILVAVGTLAALGSTLASHSRGGYYPDMRGAFDAIAADWRAGDTIAVSGYPSIGPTASYYAQRSLPPGAAILLQEDTQGLARVVRRRARIWLLTSTISNRATLERGASVTRYRVVKTALLPARAALQLVLLAPSGRTGSTSATGSSAAASRSAGR